MSNRENDAGVTAVYMSIDNVLDQLSSLKNNSASFICALDEEDEDQQIWKNDITALEATIAMITAISDEGIDDAEGLKDLLHDYNAQAAQLKELHRKYENPTKAIWRDSVWHCPECNHRVMPRHSHCHWCGKKLGGW